MDFYTKEIKVNAWCYDEKRKWLPIWVNVVSQQYLSDGNILQFRANKREYSISLGQWLVKDDRDMIVLDNDVFDYYYVEK